MAAIVLLGCSREGSFEKIGSLLGCLLEQQQRSRRQLDNASGLTGGLTKGPIRASISSP